MSAKTKFTIIGLVTAALLVCFVVIIGYLAQRIQQTSDKNQVVEKIVETSFQLALLKSEYLAHPSERAKIQWINVYEAQDRFLERSDRLFSSIEEEELLGNIIVNSKENRILFGKLIQYIELGSKNSTILQEINNQLTLKAQVSVSNALDLAEFSRQQSRVDSRILNLAVVFLGLLVSFVAVWLHVIGSQLLKSLERSKTEFISIASHQLKTPASAIKWLTERVLDGNQSNLTAQQTDYLSSIRSTNQRIIDLVNLLLNASRVELNVLTVKLSKQDLCSLVREVVDELEPAIAAKNLTLLKPSVGTPIDVWVDGAVFKMAINNIVVNAINYTPEGGTIKIDCQKISRESVVGGRKLAEDLAVISVADTGYGIPRSQQGRLFSKFFRAENARQKWPDGTGLGLYIVKYVVESFGGSVWFESEENLGTTFYLAVPLWRGNKVV